MVHTENDQGADYRDQEMKLSQEIQRTQNSDSNDHEKSFVLAQLFNNRGWTKYMQVEFDDAIVDYNKALEYLPNLAEALYNRGTIHYRMGYFKEAVTDLEKAVALQKDNREFAEGLVNARIQQGLQTQ